MRVAFRTDASASIGLGHFTRCLALADHIAASGGRVAIVTRSAHPAVTAALAVRGHDLRVLDLQPDASVAADAAASARAIDAGTDWIVVDHYGFDHRWETDVKSRASHLLAIDDLANRRHDCDVLVDPGHGREADAYAGLTSDRTDLLLGTRFALLKPMFAGRHDAAPRRLAAHRVHLFFGGGDTAARWLVQYCRWLVEGFADLEVRAVGCCDADAMQGLVQRFPERVAWQHHLDDMANHMAECDVAFGAPGSATWERACVGLPMALVATADNQVPILRNLDRTGFAAYLGRASDLDSAQFVAAFKDFLADRKSLETRRAIGIASVDGRGTERVVHRLQARGAHLG